MKRDEIMKTIKMLSGSQGFYGRMYAYLSEQKENEPEVFDRNMKVLEAQNFADVVDLVMYLES